MTDTMTPTPLVSRLKDAGFFAGDRMNPPPAERKPSVVPLELTSGCSYNGCGYCTMFRGERFSCKPLLEFRRHVDDVFDFVRSSDGKEGLGKLERIFIGSGNALAVDTEQLRLSVQYAIGAFRKATGKLPRRVAVYGNTRDIAGKRYDALRTLECGGVCGNCSVGQFGEKKALKVVYWGIESGSSDVLDYANKGNSCNMLSEAVESFRNSGLEASVMIMTGLGGTRLSGDHVRETIKILNKLRPRWITFIGTKVDGNTPYARKMSREVDAGTNRPLTGAEMGAQMASIIGGLRFGVTVGCFGSQLQTYGNNDISFGSAVLDGYNHDAELLAGHITNLVNGTGDSTELKRKLGRIMVADSSGRPIPKSNDVYDDYSRNGRYY